ncbi:hypothetical protein PENANT_c097G09795 [Penicillium antarcticum]|uniref:Uncharacterized protein n=1 Tax=Penicillium antarcticum TaxID=416450 RepID=A0A1V6PMQ5_9EURO|nr:hypothetical protein PENANT_c097G09795 [Penicillium antarcticum]
MSSFTNNVHEAIVSIPDERSDWPTLVIHELIDAPESGTEANPIVIGDDPAPLGSASNPIVIYVDEDCGYDEAEQLGSDADTEVMATPEFWEKLIDENFPAPADERADCPEEPRILEQNCPRLDDKATKDRAPKVMEDHSVVLYGQSSQAEVDQNNYEDNSQPSCGVFDTCSRTDQFHTQETLNGTNECIAKEPQHGSCGRWSTKRNLSDTDGLSLKPRRSERLIKRARQSVTRM